MEKPWKRRLAQTEIKRGADPKEVLDHARIFLKLDLGYLIAAGAIFTGLKLEIDDVLKNFGVLLIAPILFGVLASIDSLIYSFLYNDWAKIGDESSMSTDRRIVPVLMRWQVKLHMGFVIFLLASLTGYAKGSYDSYKEVEAKARVQRGIDLVLAKTGKVPTSVSELPRSDYYQGAVRKFGPEHIRIQPTTGTSYTLTFAGDDGLFDTPDDDEYSDQLSAVDIYDYVFGNKKRPSLDSKSSR